MKKKLLLLGGSGFIGRNLKEAFQRDGDMALEAPSSSQLDVLQYDQVFEYLNANKFDVVLNALDRKTDLSQQNCDARYLKERLRMFANLADCNHLYKKMLYFGSGAEYAREWPICSIREEEFGRKTPEDPYGLLMSLTSRFAMQTDNIFNFRLFGIFGKYEDREKRFISHAICCALENRPITIRQDVVFDYLYVDDLVKMVRYFISHDMRERAYNATSGKKYPLRYLAERVREILGADVPIQIAKTGLGKEYTADASKIQAETGVMAENIDESITKLATFWKESLDSRKM